jgi:hypothetical protein
MGGQFSRVSQHELHCVLRISMVIERVGWGMNLQEMLALRL